MLLRRKAVSSEIRWSITAKGVYFGCLRTSTSPSTLPQLPHVARLRMITKYIMEMKRRERKVQTDALASPLQELHAGRREALAQSFAPSSRGIVWISDVARVRLRLVKRWHSENTNEGQAFLKALEELGAQNTHRQAFNSPENPAFQLPCWRDFFW